MEEETVIVKDDKPLDDLVLPEVDLVLPEVVVEDKPLDDLVLPEVAVLLETIAEIPFPEEKYSITWVDGNEYDVVINESGIYWTKKENILNE